MVHAGLISLIGNIPELLAVSIEDPHDLAIFDIDSVDTVATDEQFKLLRELGTPTIGLLYDRPPLSQLPGPARVITLATTAEQLAGLVRSLHLVAPTLSREGNTPSGLSARELQVLLEIAAGRTNADIAEQMCLSSNTVKSYIRNAYSRIGVTSRSEAVRWALAHGLSATLPVNDLGAGEGSPLANN